jgi:transposase-like protein
MTPEAALRWAIAGRNMEAAAGLLGVRKQALYVWMRRYGVRLGNHKKRGK